MNVLVWPTADWFVSGASTYTSPSGSSACFSASRPRDSMPSSLVTRMRGRDSHSASGRAARGVARGGASRRSRWATGSPRSRSMSRRSTRSRLARPVDRWPVAIAAGVALHAVGSAGFGVGVAGLAAWTRLAVVRRLGVRVGRARVDVPRSRRLAAAWARAPPALAFADAFRGARCHVARHAGVAAQEVVEERGDHGGERHREDRAGDAGDLEADDAPRSAPRSGGCRPPAPSRAARRCC